VNFLIDWENAVPFPLNRTNVIRYVPEASGVYGLRNTGSWVYIGEGANIRGALLRYLSGRLPSVLISEPHLFVFELCSPRKRAERHRELVQRYQPMCNKKPLTAKAAG
jgi:hypothetical protein